MKVQFEKIELQAAIALQQAIRNRNAYNAIEKNTNLNILQLSEKNLSALKKRLIYGASLPKHIKAAIQQEKKKPGNMLTPAEVDLYGTLLAMPMYINHASPEFEYIENTGIIHSIVSLKANDISVDVHTAHGYGLENYVFFSYGLKSKSPRKVNFLGEKNAFVFNLDNMFNNKPLLMSGAWCSGHFYAYNMEQTLTPTYYRYREHHTKVAMQYWFIKSPLIRYYRKLTFTYPDGSRAKFQLERSEEITAGRDIKPWHALRFIEFVRFLDPEIRHYILKNHTNSTMMKEMYDSIFTPGKAEFHFPHHYNLEWSFETISEFETGNSQRALQALGENNLKNLSRWINVGSSRNARFEYSGRKKLSLLNLALLQGNQAAVLLLLKAGYDPNSNYLDTRQKIDTEYAARNTIQDAVELNDVPMIKLLLYYSVQQDSLSITYTAWVSRVIFQTAIAIKDKNSILSLLLKHLPKLDGHLEQLLLFASYYNNRTAIQTLIKHGADVNRNSVILRDSDNAHLIHANLFGTPLTVAAEFGQYEAVEILLNHKADCNQPAMSSHPSYLYGSSPLMAAITGLEGKDANILQPNEKTLGAYYSNNKRSNQKFYIRIIKLLIEKGASVQYQDDFGLTIIQCIKNCLQVIKSDTLKKIVSDDKKDQLKFLTLPDKPTETAAIITSNNQQNEPLLLLGRQRYRKGELLAVPSGKVNYKLEGTLKESVINITGVQTNINLIDAELRRESLYRLQKNMEYNKQVFHFSLKTPQEPFALPVIYLRSLEPFTDIFWIKISDLEFCPIEYLGKIFPMYYYNELPLPLYVCPYVAKLAGIDTPFDELKSMVELFSLNAKKFAISAIQKGQLNQLKTIFLLGLFQNNPKIPENFIQTAFELREYEIVLWLIRANLTIDTFDLKRFLNNRPVQSSLSFLIITLIRLYPHILEDFENVDALAHYAFEHEITELIDLIPGNRMSHLVGIAIQQNKVSVLSYLQLQFELERFLHESIRQLRVQICCLSVKPANDIISSLQLIRYLATLDTPNHVEVRCQLIKDILLLLLQSGKKNEAIESTINMFHQLLIDQLHTITGKPLFPSFYENFVISYNHRDVEVKHNHRKNMILKTILEIPVLALYCGIHQKDHTILDFVLSKYAQHAGLQAHLKKYMPYFPRDENGDTPLVRAVLQDNLRIMELFSLNHTTNFKIKDSQGRTLLENAVRTGSHQAAQFLEGREIPTKKLFYFNLKRDIEKHARAIFTQTYLQPFPGKGPKADLYSLPIERISHGVQHATRTAIFTKICIHLYQAMGNPEALQLTDDDIVILQIVALCHDAMRKNDQEDLSEKESAAYCQKYLLDMGINKDKAKLFAMAISSQGDTLLGRILQSADCLEVPRVRRTFFINCLCIFQDAPFEYRRLIFELVREGIRWQASQHDLKYNVSVEFEGNAACLFSIDATRNADKPELKKYYEHHSRPYSICVHELKNHPILNAYYHSSDVQKSQFVFNADPTIDAALARHMHSNNPNLLFKRSKKPDESSGGNVLRQKMP